MYTPEIGSDLTGLPKNTGSGWMPWVRAEPALIIQAGRVFNCLRRLYHAGTGSIYCGIFYFKIPLPTVTAFGRLLPGVLHLSSGTLREFFGKKVFFPKNFWTRFKQGPKKRMLKWLEMARMGRKIIKFELLVINSLNKRKIAQASDRLILLHFLNPILALVLP